MYRTGEEVPHPGIYLFERHRFDTSCQPSQDEKKVPLDRGDEFPGCPKCGDAGRWSYHSAKDKRD